MAGVNVYVGFLTNCRIRNTANKAITSGKIGSFDASSGAEGVFTCFVESGYAGGKNSGDYANPTVQLTGSDDNYNEEDFPQFVTKINEFWSRIDIPLNSDELGGFNYFSVNAVTRTEGFALFIVSYIDGSMYDQVPPCTITPGSIYNPVQDTEFAKRSTGYIDDTKDCEFIISPNQGYAILNAIIDETDGDLTLERLADGSYKYTIKAGSVGWGGYGISDVKVSVQQATLEDYYITLDLGHCSANIENTEINHGGSVVLTSGDVPTLTPATGYAFTSDTVATWAYNGEVYNGVLQDDGTITFPDVPLTNIVANIVVTANAELNEVPVEAMDLGFVNVYHPTQAELILLSQSGWPAFEHQDPDVAQYIIKVYKTFIRPLDADAKVTALFGSFNTHVQVFPVLDQYAIADCGTVLVDEIFVNALDYEPVTTMQLWLPFVGLKEVNTADVMGREVHLKYTMNVLNGNILAELYREEDGVLINSWTGNCAEEIEFIVNTRTQRAGGEDNLSAYGMGNRTPYFIRKTRKLLFETEFDDMMKSLSAKVQIGNMTGLCKFDNVDISGIIATSQERDEIATLLRGGVYL